MTTTANLDLPLVQAAQAQKHVTVNEALGLIDALAQLRLASVDLSTAPGEPAEGETYAIASGAGGDWAGKSRQIALFLNGGWVFAIPRVGWRAWVADRGATAIFDGAGWVIGAAAVSPNGAATISEVVEIDLVLGAGAGQDSAAIIPSGCVVQGVTGRIVTEITGTATSWRLGVPGSTDRYGTGYGTAEGSWIRGLTGQPQAYYSDTALTVEAESGAFSAGTVRLAVHLSRFTLPRA